MKNKFKDLIILIIFTLISSQLLIGYNYPYVKVINNSNLDVTIRVSVINKTDENWKIKKNQSIDLILLEKNPQSKIEIIANKEPKYIFYDIRDMFSSKYPNIPLNKNAQAEIVIYNNPEYPSRLKVNFKLTNLADIQKKSENFTEFSIDNISGTKKVHKRISFLETSNFRKESPEGWEHEFINLKEDSSSNVNSLEKQQESGKSELSRQPSFSQGAKFMLSFENIFSKMKNSLNSNEEYQKMIKNPEYINMLEKIDEAVTYNRMIFKKTDEYLPLSIRVEKNYERERNLDELKNKIKFKEKLNFLKNNPQYVDVLNQVDQLDWIKNKFLDLRSNYLNKNIQLKELQEFLKILKNFALDKQSFADLFNKFN